MKQRVTENEARSWAVISDKPDCVGLSPGRDWKLVLRDYAQDLLAARARLALVEPVVTAAKAWSVKMRTVVEAGTSAAAIARLLATGCEELLAAVDALLKREAGDG